MPIIIQIDKSRGKPTEYDIASADPKVISNCKKRISYIINQKDKKKLNAVKTQLNALVKNNKNNEFLMEQLGRVRATLKQSKKEKPIELKPAQAKYDIRDPKRRKLLEKNIQGLGRNHNLARLKVIQNQIAKLTPEEKIVAKNIKTMVDGLVVALEATAKYKSYAEQLSDTFLAARAARSPFQGVAKKQEKAIIKYRDPKLLTAYLDCSVTKKRATGEKAYQQLSACFWFDFTCLTNFMGLDTDSEQLLCFAAIIANLFSHNSSYYPAQGLGKSPRRECEQPLFYYRSQQKHDRLRFIQPNDSKYYGAPNQAFKAMVVRFMGGEIGAGKHLVSLDDDGNYVSAETGGRPGEFFAHLGARSNNANLMFNAMKKVFKGKGADALKQFVPQSKKEPTKISAGFANIAGSLHMIQARFSELNVKFSKRPLYDNLQSKIAKHRKNKAKTILEESLAILGKTADVAYLNPLRVSYEESASFLYIDLYHSLPARTKEKINYKEGLTNLLIGFFGGLLDFNAKKRGLHTATQRRQSFGFLQPTLTDAGSMRMRLSFGLEPVGYQAVVAETIKQFNDILKTFNFVDSGKIIDARRRALVEKTSQPCERSQRSNGEASDQTGNYWRFSMRNEDDQWIAFLMTQHYLNKNPDGSIEKAFESYLQEFVIDRCNHKKIDQADHKSLKRNGYSLINDVVVTLPAGESADFNETVFIEQNPIFQVLSNLVKQVVAYISTHEHLPVSYSCYHLILKLLHNCEKAEAILNNLSRYDASHLHNKANLLIDNIFEYLIPLRHLLGDHPSIEGLHEFEKQKLAVQLGVGTGQFQLYYNDSGQQANTTALFTMIRQQDAPEALKKEIYFLGQSYFEVPAFCGDVVIKHERTKDSTSPIWFSDITNLHLLKERLPKISQGKFPNLTSVIVDITHNSSESSMARLRETVTQLHQMGIWVVLSCSSLKHEELGQDKYQFGKNIVIPPEGKALKAAIKTDLENISQEASNPTIATFRHTVESVVNEHAGLPIPGLSQFGIFAQDKVKKVDTPTPRSPCCRGQACLARGL